MNWFFLVGFMGVGKTTLGAEVAERLGLPFYDLDARIVQEAGASVPQIFESEGEEGFRERETRALRRLLEGEAHGVVATGGGAFTIEENRTMMASAGVSVWLDVPAEEILDRVGGEGRPLWSDDTEARALLARRARHYRLATHHLQLAGCSEKDAARELYNLLAVGFPEPSE